MRRLKTIVVALLILAFLGGVTWFFVHDPHADTPKFRRQAVVDTPEESDGREARNEAVSWPDDAPRMVVGTVLNDSDQLIGGATIRIEIAPKKPARVARSHRDGTFKVTGIPAEADRIEVSARGYETLIESRPVFEAKARVERNFVLTRKPGIFGLVHANGEPASQAWIYLKAIGAGRILRGGRTDDAGRFELPWPNVGPVELHAMHGQYGQASIEVLEEGEVEIELPGGGYLEGVVVDQTGEGLDSFSVSATRMTQGSGGPPAMSFDGVDGYFRLGPLAAGPTRVWAVAPGYQLAELRNIEVKVGETVAELRLVMKQSSVLRGRVTDARTGRPIEGAEIIPAEWRARALAESVGAYTDSDGNYQLTALPGVRTSVQVKHPDYRDLLLGGVEGAAGETMTRNFELTPQGEGRPTRELTGIGAVLQLRRNGVRIGQIVEDGPAAEQLKAGDLIVSVDGDSVGGGRSLAPVAQAIRGEEGSEVRLGVRRNGRGPVEFITIRRGRVTMPNLRRRRHRNPHQN